MRTGKEYLFRAPVAKDPVAITCVLTETNKQAESAIPTASPPIAFN